MRREEEEEREGRREEGERRAEEGGRRGRVGDGRYNIIPKSQTPTKVPPPRYSSGSISLASRPHALPPGVGGGEEEERRRGGEEVPSG